MFPKMLLCIAALVLASGCATITRGTEEAFAIESNPPGATASLSTGLTCTTPCSIKVKRRGDFTVEIEKEGYEPVTATVTSSIDGAGGAGMAGNVILGGLIGAGVDAGSGAMHSHKPNPLTVNLVKVDGAESSATASSSSQNSENDPLNITIGGAALARPPDDPTDDEPMDAGPIDPLEVKRE